MRRLSLALLLLMPLPALAQAASSAPFNDPAWLRVQQLKPGSSLHIKTTHGTVRCSFRAATPDALTCVKKTDVVLQRTEIKTIGVSHRGRSTLVGLAIGAGGGAVGGASAGHSGDFVGKGGLATLFGVAFGIIGAGIGAATDFTGGTVYRAP